MASRSGIVTREQAVPATTADLAVQLPWLAPSVPALVALARGGSLDVPAILDDPAAVALILRFVGNHAGRSLALSSKRRARLLRFVRRQLALGPCGLSELSSLPLARSAHRFADPDHAAQAHLLGLLVPLGRLAVAA